MPTRIVRIATSADSPPRLQGEVVALDRFSATVALETREAALREGANVWLHFDAPGGGSSLSVAGIVSGMAKGRRVTVLLSLSPGEYSRLQGLPDPEVRRGRRAAQPSLLAPPASKPIQKREVPEPRPERESPRPAQPAETPSLASSAVEPDVASLSPIERARALAAALEEMVGPSVKPAPPRPSELAAAPVETVTPPPEPVSPSPAAPVGAPAGAVAPPIEPVSPSRVEPAEVLAAAEPTWLRPAESAEVPVEAVEPPPEPASVSPAETMETVTPPIEPVSPSPVGAPAGTVAPPIEPVSPSPVEVVEAAAVIEPSAEPPWLRPIEAPEVPVEAVEPLPEPASVSPAETMETATPPPEPAGVSPAEQAEAPPPAVKPSAVRLSLIARARAWAAGLAERVGPSAEPASSRPSEPVEAPMPVIAPSAEPVSPTPVEAVEAAAVIEPSAEPPWLRPIEAPEVPVEAVEPPPEPASVSPAETMETVAPPPESVGVSLAEQAEALAARGELEGAWKVYYDALRVAPEDLRLWHGLGLTLSRLDRRKEAEEIFRYVVSRGDPDSEEMQHALQWLVDAASPPKPAAPAVPAAPPAKPAAPAVPAAPRAEREPWGIVYGKVTWREPEPPREAFLVLQGLDMDGPRLHTRVPLGESYEFGRLPPGSYHLIGGVENEWLWDLRFTVEADQEVVLDLSKQNSTNPRARV